MSEESKIDWRVGLRVKAKINIDRQMFGEGKVIAAYPDGYTSIICKNGVLDIKLDDGRTLTDAADNWITA